MRPVLLAAVAVLFLVSLPRPADAAHGNAYTRLNLRAGPGTNFPIIGVIPPNRNMNIFGCMRGWQWCDVSYGGMRGWAAGSYLRGYAPGYNQYLPVESYGGILGLAASLLFDQEDYWGRHYSDRDFYYRAYPAYRARPYYPRYYYSQYHRDRWNWSLLRRREALRDQRERERARRERIQERREDFRERAQERREDRRDAERARRDAERARRERQRDWRAREWQRDRWDRGRDERARSRRDDDDRNRRHRRSGDRDRDGDRDRRGR